MILGFLSDTHVTTLRLVNDAASPKVDVIFIHGLDGDGFKSWRFHQEPSWHTWIHEWAPSARVWTLDYRVRSSGWFGGSMPLSDRARNVLATIKAEIGTPALPIVMITHSYGGLLVKQMIKEGRENQSSFAYLMNRLKGLVFLGTPHSGSGVANLVSKVGILTRSSGSIRELRRSEPLLRELNTWFRRNVRYIDVKILAYFETVDTYGQRIVDEVSADPNIEGVDPIGVDANHLEICKPLSPDFRVKDSIALINEVGEVGGREISTDGQMSLLQKMIASNDDELALLGRKAKRAVDANPKDEDAAEAYEFFERTQKHPRSFHVERSSSKPGIYGLGVNMPEGAWAWLFGALYMIPVIAIDKMAFDGALTQWVVKTLKHILEILAAS